jgi:hypothetical protein
LEEEEAPDNLESVNPYVGGFILEVDEPADDAGGSILESIILIPPNGLS